MTREEMIAKIESVSETDDDVLVGYYLDNAEEIILNQLYRFDESIPEEGFVVPARYTNLWLRITMYLLQKAGSDGEVTHVENGMHRHYGASDVPSDMMRQILPKAVCF